MEGISYSATLVLPLSAGKTAVAVSAGVYVVNGQKVIVK